MFKIIFLDVDGTLLDSMRGVPDVSSFNLYAISRLKEKGVKVVISTGRSKFLLNKELVKAEADGLILCNGSYIEADSTVISNILLSFDAIRHIEDKTNENGGICLYENQNGLHSIGNRDNELKRFIDKWNIPFLKITHVDKVPVEVNKIIPVFNTEEGCSRFFNSLNRNIVIAKRQKGIFAFDVSPANITKGEAVKKLLNNYGIDRAEACAFGDSSNDIEMFSTVGKSIAVLNAEEELKKIADEICDDAINDALYNWLVKNRMIERMN